MTDKEAIEALTDKDIVNPILTLEALEIAIDALKERAERKGKWIFCGYATERDWELGIKSFKCSICDKKGDWRSPYCPNCGAEMEVEE